MKIQRSIAGVLMFGLILSAAACNYSGSPMKTLDGKTLGEDQNPEPAKDTSGDQKTETDAQKGDSQPAPLTIADFAGTWKATSYVRSKNGEEADFVAKGIYQEVGLVVGNDGSAQISVAVEGKPTESVSFKLVLEDGKLHFIGLDKVQQEPFAFSLDGNVLDWMVPPIDDYVTFVRWERVSQDAAVPEFLTLSEIAGSWNVTGYRLTDAATGQQYDFIKNGMAIDLTLGADGVASSKVVKSGQLSEKSGKVILTDGHVLSFDGIKYEVVLDEGGVMHWTTQFTDNLGHLQNVAISFQKE